MLCGAAGALCRSAHGGVGVREQDLVLEPVISVSAGKQGKTLPLPA